MSYSLISDRMTKSCFLRRLSVLCRRSSAGGRHIPRRLHQIRSSYVEDFNLQQLIFDKVVYIFQLLFSCYFNRESVVLFNVNYKIIKNIAVFIKD